MKPTGYLVAEYCEEWEQPLRLVLGDALPDGGVLDWGVPAAIFPNRKAARAAITRTEHLRLAFGKHPDLGHLPERKLCKIVPVLAVGSK